MAIVLVAAVFLAYQPCWHAGFIWDDNAHVTRPALRSLHGLYRIWSDVAATTQYYPLLHSVFWLEHILWGDAASGYHFANLALHACAAVLVLALLRRLEIPGVLLAAAIFALHPVHVESVAWITEQKNTLSAVFIWRPRCCYLRFDRTRRPIWYAGAAALFVAALLSKTLTGTLPGALLVVFWWQRGRLSLEARRPAAGAIFSAGGRLRPADGVVGIEDQPMHRPGLRLHVRPTAADRRTDGLVLLREAPLAGTTYLHLSALADRRPYAMAVSLSFGGTGIAGAFLGDPPPLAGSVGRPAVLWRNSVPRARFSQPVHVSLFVRGRSLPISGEPGVDRACFGRRGSALGTYGRVAKAGLARRPAWFCWRCWRY